MTMFANVLSTFDSRIRNIHEEWAFGKKVYIIMVMCIFQDPRHHIFEVCTGYDVCAMMDGIRLLNTGFMLFKSSEKMVTILENRLNMTKKTDQV